MRRIERRCPFEEWPVNDEVNDEVGQLLGIKFAGGDPRRNRTAAVVFGGDGGALGIGTPGAIAFGGGGAPGAFEGTPGAIAFGGSGIVADEPGATCGEALEISLATDYTYDIGSGTPPPSHWFTLPITSGNEYHLTLTVNSGSIGSVTVSDGTCSSSTIKFILFGTGCNSATFSSGPNMLIQVAGSLSASGNYTIRAGTGACP